jgi:HD-GYP domain-containing protein (c-di-GMP phosphodiesterase class II)
MIDNAKKSASTADSGLQPLSASRPRWRIIYSLLVMLVFVCLVPLLFTYWILIDMNRETLRTIQKERQLSIANFISETITSHVQESVGRIEAIAQALENDREFKQSSDFSSALQEHGTTILQRALDVDGEKTFFYLALVDKTRGSGVTASLSFDQAEIERQYGYKLQEIFSRVQGWTPTAGELPKPLIGEAFVLRERALPVVAGARPIVWKGTVHGVLLALVNLQPLLEGVTDLSTDRNTVYLVNGSGRLFAHHDRTEMLDEPDYSDLPIVEPLLEPTGRAFTTAMDFTVETTGGSRVGMLGTSKWIPVLDCMVVIQISDDDAYYPVHQMVRKSVTWAVVWLVAAVIVGWLFVRRISLPVQQLAEATRSAAAGDFSARVAIRSADEIGQLARTFNFMSVNLENYITRLKTAMEKYNQLFLGSLHMIAEAIDEKDPYTRGHAERVTTYSLAIGRRMGLTDEELEPIRIAALLHDVGKIGIDDRVLKKQDVLTDEEYALMKMHPVKGAGIMAPIAEMAESVPGVKYHHEYFGGGGYPEGLSGEEIPVMARIIGVADTFDAMTTDRCYQPRMPSGEAVDQIKSLTDIRYDPEVVAALDAAVRAGEIAPA